MRSLEPDDIPQLVALRRRVFSHSSQPSDTALGSYYRKLLFENPWQSDRYPSFVHEGSAGEIVGFVGAIPRPMLLGTERIIAVTSTELMVAPEARGLIGAKLFRRLFDGPQQLTVSDRSNDQARVLYENLGGSAALWYSLYWTVALDGSRISFEPNPPRITTGAAARAVRRASRLLDRLSAGSIIHGPVSTRAEPLAFETVVQVMQKVAGKKTLVPEYDSHSFSWLLDRVAETRKPGRVVSAQVIQDAAPIGWFIWVTQPDGTIDLVQMVSLPGREGLVFDQLINHALADGGTVLRGRLDRRFAPLISERGFPLTVGQPWTVVRSESRDLIAQFASGNAMFTRLDAEWWITT